MIDIKKNKTKQELKINVCSRDAHICFVIMLYVASFCSFVHSLDCVCSVPDQASLAWFACLLFARHFIMWSNFAQYVCNKLNAIDWNSTIASASDWTHTQYIRLFHQFNKEEIASIELYIHNIHTHIYMYILSIYKYPYPDRFIPTLIIYMRILLLMRSPRSRSYGHTL